MPAVAERWTKIKGKAPDQDDVDAIFKDFVPMQVFPRMFSQPDLGKTISKVLGSQNDTNPMNKASMQVAVLPKYAGLLPGAGEACTYMQDQLGLKLGSTTGFT
jgi:hypothetical protein